MNHNITRNVILEVMTWSVHISTKRDMLLNKLRVLVLRLIDWLLHNVQWAIYQMYSGQEQVDIQYINMQTLGKRPVTGGLLEYLWKYNGLDVGGKFSCPWVFPGLRTWQFLKTGVFNVFDWTDCEFTQTKDIPFRGLVPPKRWYPVAILYPAKTLQRRSSICTTRSNERAPL